MLWLFLLPDEDWNGKHSAWISTHAFGENPNPPIIKKEVEQR